MSAERVLEVHGAVRWLQCSKPCCPDVWKAPNDLGLTEDATSHRVAGVMPCCPKCKAVARPNVQMFGGDSGFSRARRGAQNTRYDAWINTLANRPDVDSLRVVCIEVGCGLTVPTVRRELEKVVQRFPGGRLIRVNPENPGLAKELVSKGVSVPLPGATAIEKLSKQERWPKPMRRCRRRTSSGVKAEDVKSKPHSGLPPELERRGHFGFRRAGPPLEDVMAEVKQAMGPKTEFLSADRCPPMELYQETRPWSWSDCTGIEGQLW
eukprot:g18084.t1